MKKFIIILCMLIFAILSCLFCFKINAIFLKNKDVSKIDSSINKEDSNNSINEVKTDLIEKENTGFVDQNIINDFETDKEKNQILNKIKIMKLNQKLKKSKVMIQKYTIKILIVIKRMTLHQMKN